MEDALCIVVDIVEVAEPCDAELCDVCPPLLEDVEPTEDVCREVEACKVVEEHVVACIRSCLGTGVVERGAGGIGDKEDEGDVAFRRERAFRSGSGIVRFRLQSTSVPEAGDVVGAAVDGASRCQAFGNHSCHFRHVAFRIFLQEGGKHGTDAVRGNCAKLREGMYENEFRAVETLGEILRGAFVEFLHTLAVALAVSVVGEGIERVFYLASVAGMVFIVWVTDDRSHGIVGIGRPQPLPVFFRNVFQPLGFGGMSCHPFAFAPTAVEQEHVVACLVETVEIRELSFQASEGFGSKSEVFKLVLLHDGSVEERFAQDGVRFCLLLCSKWDLCQIVFALVRVVDRVVLFRFFRFQACLFLSLFLLFEPSFDVFFAHSCSGERILYGLLEGLDAVGGGIVVGIMVVVGKHRAVAAAPVVLVLAVAPCLLESLFTLVHQLYIVEVPFFRGVLLRGFLHIPPSSVLPFAFLHGLSPSGLRCGVAPCFPFLLLLFLQFGNHAVDGGKAFAFAGGSKPLQGVLEVDGRGGGNQGIEHLGTSGDFFVVFEFLVNESDGFGEARLCLVEPAVVPIDVTEAQQQYSGLQCALRGFGASSLVGTYSGQRVALSHMDVADGIVHLVEIVLVVVAFRHPLQAFHHGLGVGGSGDGLGLQDAGMECHFVGWAVRNAFSQSLVGILLAVESHIGLGKEVIEACPACFPFFALDGAFQVG